MLDEKKLSFWSNPGLLKRETWRQFLIYARLIYFNVNHDDCGAIYYDTTHNHGKDYDISKLTEVKKVSHVQFSAKISSKQPHE